MSMDNNKQKIKEKILAALGTDDIDYIIENYATDLHQALNRIEMNSNVAYTIAQDTSDMYQFLTDQDRRLRIVMEQQVQIRADIEHVRDEVNQLAAMVKEIETLK